VSLPVRTLEDLPLPRRVAAAQLLGEILATEQALADFYERLAARPGPPGLRAALAALARDKRAQSEALLPGLAPFARPAASPAGPAPLAAKAPTDQRAEAFLAAFALERGLEMRYREVLALLGDAAPAPVVAEAAARAARHRAAFRDLYRRYS